MIRSTIPHDLKPQFLTLLEVSDRTKKFGDMYLDLITCTSIPEMTVSTKTQLLDFIKRHM